MHYNEVLASNRQVRKAIRLLDWEHPTTWKTWDLLKAFHFILRHCPDRQSRVLDAACVGSPILELLYDAGYSDLHGCDLSSARLPNLPNFHFVQCDMTATPFEESSFEVITCLSAIEHGVPLTDFFGEMRRLLRNDGRLLLSTDYHEPKVHTNSIPMDLGSRGRSSREARSKGS
jgi:SAM-dependent methyltransferase